MKLEQASNFFLLCLLLQIQEIGDLQQTLSMKQDYRKMQRSLQQKTKLYQEAMCEKMELQKQVIIYNHHNSMKLSHRGCP